MHKHTHTLEEEEQEEIEMNLYFPQHSCALHSAGHVYTVAPDVILGLLGSDHPCYHRTVVYPWQHSTQRQRNTEEKKDTNKESVERIRSLG